MMDGTEHLVVAPATLSPCLIDKSTETLNNPSPEESLPNGTKTSHDVIDNSDETKLPPQPEFVSKRQLKKLKKLQEYQSMRKERRAIERQRIKDRRAAAIAQGLPFSSGPSRKELKKRQNATSEHANAFNIAIDLDYDDLMSDSDISKCIKQCLRIYTINRRSEKPCRLHFTGIKTDGRIHGVLKKNDGWQNWHLQYHFDKTHATVFDKTKLIYLTCESVNVLDKLEPDCTYVIGGLVDHNHQKGLCHDRAIKANIQTARLPLSEHVDMKTRSVLSTFHVFQMLLYISEGKSWTQAILETIPPRKGAKAKEPPVMNSKEEELILVPETQKQINETTTNTSC